MAFLGKFKGGYQDLWKAIIRPPRDEYTLTDLGPKEFRLQGRIYRRTDLKIKNKRGFNIECSHYEPVKRVAEQLPCVIYLHGNCSSRIEALPSVEVLLPANITLFCFDFSGCGLSEGEYISLGWYERDDVEAIVDFLRASNRVSTIGLWGRSMGAVTAIMHADRDPTIAGMVLDSPFSDLRTLAEELCKNHTKIPKFILSGALAIIRKTIQGKAKFDINDLVPMNHVQSGFIPAFFVTGKQDTFILPHHTQNLYDKYSGDKNVVMVEGDHNSVRPQFLLDSIAIFFYNTLLCNTLPKDTEVPKGKKEDSVNLTQKYVKHNNQVNNLHNVGNEEQVASMLEDFGEEELRLAMEESLKITQEEDKKKQTNGLLKRLGSGTNIPSKGDILKVEESESLKKMGVNSDFVDDNDDIFVPDNMDNPYSHHEESKQDS